MTQDRPILGIDLGSMTLAAAIATPGEVPKPLHMPIRGHQTCFYASELPVSPDGELHRPDYTGPVETAIGTITRFLGCPPQTIAGQPYGIHTLINTMLGPVIDQAALLPTPPHTIAAVVPEHWPHYIVDSYITALKSTGMNATPVLASQAITSYADSICHDGIITCLDMGAQTATLTLAMPTDKHRQPTITTTTTKGGLNWIARQVIIHIAAKRIPTLRPTKTWMKQATAAGKRLLRATEQATTPETPIIATLPAPIGKIQIPAGHINNLVEDLTTTALNQLSNHEDIHNYWADDQKVGVGKNLLIAGGFSRTKAIGRAIRTTLGRYHAHPHPENILAMGAAHHIAKEFH